MEGSLYVLVGREVAPGVAKQDARVLDLLADEPLGAVWASERVLDRLGKVDLDGRVVDDLADLRVDLSVRHDVCRGASIERQKRGQELLAVLIDGVDHGEDH